jgi:nucleoside-diphosphate-sugar epimerase
MNVLVIGGAGFLGSNLVRRCLAESENEVTVLDLLDPMLKSTTEHLRPIWERIRFVRGSMSDEPLIAEMVQGKDIIFNCAAQTSHPLSLQDPIYDAEINCVGNLKVLEAVRLLNPSAVVVYTSSSTVVGRAVGDVIDETHAEKPLDIYSANKGVAEKYYRIYNRVHDLKTVVLRFANLYGPYGKGYAEFGFVNYFIHQAAAGKEITVFGDGRQKRNVLFVEDATEVLYRAAFEPRLVGEVFFATHDEHLAVIDIARHIVSVFGGKLNHVEWPDERRRIDVDDVHVSSALLRSIVSWEPRYRFVEGLERTRLKMQEARA